MNPLFGLLNGSGNTNSNSGGAMPLIKRMIGAAMAGQSPEQFLNGLTQTDARFKGMDFTNLEKTAKKVCGRKNIDLSDAVNKVSNGIKNLKW